MQTDMSSFQLFKQEVSRANLRVTIVRTEIFHVLQKTNQPLSILDIAKQCPTAHYVSVYRSIDSLTKAGIIKQVPQGFKNVFELSDTFQPHHHHTTCERCGISSEVNDERIETLMKQLTRQSGMRPTKHHFEMYGICKKCEYSV